MNKIIQWNIRRARINFCELLLLITKYCPAIICLQETYLKNNTSINMKNYYSYNYIKQYTDRPCSGSSIIINNDIPHSEITQNTNVQAVAISPTLHKTIPVCSVYIPPKEEPKELELNNLIEQLLRPFVIMGDFNSHNEIWESKKTDKKGKVIESLLNQHQLCMYNNKSNTYLHPATGTYSAIDLSICDSWAKARKIKDSKRNTWRNYIAKINSNTKPKNVWQMIRKITGQNNNTPTKHLTHNNLKISDEKDIANHLVKTFSQNSSAKNQSKSFQIIKTKAKKVKKSNFKAKTLKLTTNLSL